MVVIFCFRVNEGEDGGGVGVECIFFLSWRNFVKLWVVMVFVLLFGEIKCVSCCGRCFGLEEFRLIS